MAVPDAVMTFLRGMADSEQIADHPQINALYSMATGTINTSVWGSNASLALALVTAHYCLTYPPAEAHLDRTPVESVQGAGGPTKYMKIDVTDANAFLTTAPGRQYSTLRRTLLGSGTPRVL
jgi:hypothetical protein